MGGASIYIFSLSITIDDSWMTTKKYLDSTINLSDDEPPLYHPNFDEHVVEEIMTTQKKWFDNVKLDIFSAEYVNYLRQNPF